MKWVISVAALIGALRAVLFLLLISGETLKWADITPSQLSGIGVLQLILTGCVGFSVAVWMIMNPRRVYKSITVSSPKLAPMTASGECALARVPSLHVSCGG